MTKVIIPRRHFLYGAGGFALALPVLRSLQPRTARAGDPPFARNPRFVCYTTEHGGVWDEFMWPAASMLTEQQSYAGRTIRRGDLVATADGDNSVVSPVLTAATDVLSPGLLGKLNIVQGLDHPFYIGHHRGGHLGNYAENDANGSDGAYMQGFPRPTIDQVMAWSSSFYPDLTTILERSMVVGNDLSWGWSSPESGSGEVQEMPSVGSSLELFNKIFVPMPDDLANPRPPLVDRVMEHYQSLRQSNRRLSAGDRQRIDAHLERLDELQRKLEVAVSCGDVEPPSESSDDVPYGGDPSEQAHYWQLFNDVIVAAFMCGTSRIAVLRTENTFSSFEGDWHEAVHQSSQAHDETAEDNVWRANQVFFAEVLADLARKLDVDEGDGVTVLDNSLLMWSQESGPATHESVSQPIITFGSAAGVFRTGQYLDYRDTSVGVADGFGGEIGGLHPGLCYNQWLGSVLQAMGLPKSEYEQGDYGGYGEVFVGQGRAESYPDAVFQAAGDMLPWLAQT